MNKIDVSALDVKLLRMFLTVFEEKSVTRASERLECSQSAVSHGLERLRQYIGDPLFVKHGRSIAPTPVAVSIAPKVTDILISIEALTLQGEYTPSEDKTTFTIAANVVEHMAVLTHVHTVLRERHPDMSLTVMELGVRTNAQPLLEKGQADAAIIAALGQHPVEFMVERFYQDTLVCFYDPTQRSAPSSPEEYYAARHAVVDFGGGTKSVVDAAMDNTGTSRQIVLRAASSHALANLAQGTDMVITMPRRLSLCVFAEFAMCEPPVALPMVSYDLVCHGRMQSSSRHAWFMDGMRVALERFKQGPALAPTA
ncbi:MAG: LysR family transcriptional regulator [Pseudomonadota bacterium]